MTFAWEVSERVMAPGKFVKEINGDPKWTRGLSEWRTRKLQLANKPLPCRLSCGAVREKKQERTNLPLELSVLHLDKAKRGEGRE